MARRSAINPVADAVVVALNVTTLRALAPGGVSRNRPANQVPPYVSLGPCSEVAADAAGTNYGADVTVPVRVITGGDAANGESRAASILDEAMRLLDLRTSLTVTGWQVLDIWWRGNRIAEDPQADGTMNYVGTATFLVQVRQS
jgi:hypothetical protein